MFQRAIPSYLVQVKQFPLRAMNHSAVHLYILATIKSLMCIRENNVSGWMADMTTTLTVNTAEVENKTNITCQTQRGIVYFHLPLYCRLGEYRATSIL